MYSMSIAYIFSENNIDICEGKIYDFIVNSERED